MLQGIVEIQRDIYLTVAGHIRAYAEGGDGTALILFIPAGIAFGAIHALTPGHSKTVLATYVAGSSAGLGRALAISGILASTHIASAVAIALLSLPLVSRALDNPGGAPLIEAASRLVLGAFGIWMIWRGLRVRSRPHDSGSDATFSVVVGLVPCPLTLFVMTFASARDVPEAGLAFAAAMVAGVGATLAAVAIATVTVRARLASMLTTHGGKAERIARACEVFAGLALLLIAAMAVLRP